MLLLMRALFELSRRPGEILTVVARVVAVSYAQQRWIRACATATSVDSIGAPSATKR